MVPDADYRIKLQAFEGPLDLLLFLIRKNELDIYDIPIEQITRQYLETIFAMQELDLELAGTFFVMAATLMEIKSRMLLPRDLQAIDPNATDEDEMDPRWELVHQLIQYRKFKEAATRLGELAVERQDMIARYVSVLSPAASDRCRTGIGSNSGMCSMWCCGGWPRNWWSGKSTTNRSPWPTRWRCC